MKIDYITIGYFPIIGGTETVVKNIAEIMAKRGHEVTVHTSTYNPNFNGNLKDSEIINGVKVLRYKLHPLHQLERKLSSVRKRHIFYLIDFFHM